MYVVALPEGQVTAVVLRGAGAGEFEALMVLRTVVLAVLLGYKTDVLAIEPVPAGLVPAEPVLYAVPDVDTKVEFAVAMLELDAA